MIKPKESFDGLNITFQTTEDCNLACSYCYEVDKKAHHLPIEYAQKFIDILLEDEDPIGCKGTENEWILNQGVVLDFIGGDSLMNPKLVDKILSYFIFKSTLMNHKWAKRWRASISSNGTLFGNKDVKDLMIKYKDNLHVGVSLDGCPEIHDKNRIFKDGRGTLSEIKKNWEWYKQWQLAHTTLGTKATCNKDSIPYLFKSIKYLHEEFELTDININFVFEDLKLTEDDLKLLDSEMGKCVDYIYEHKEDLYVSMFDKGFGIGNPMKEEDLDKGWCGAGSMPTLTINGKIYPCFRFTPNTMHNREKFDFYVGDVWNGFNHKERFKEVRDQTRRKISPEKCKICPAESSCAWCIGGAFSETGTFWRQTNICEIKKLQDKWSRIYWERYDNWEKSKQIS
jgi:uncharacterized protein